jgi:hypothetical protein
MSTGSSRGGDGQEAACSPHPPGSSPGGEVVDRRLPALATADPQASSLPGDSDAADPQASLPAWTSGRSGTPEGYATAQLEEPQEQGVYLEILAFALPVSCPARTTRLAGGGWLHADGATRRACN